MTTVETGEHIELLSKVQTQFPEAVVSHSYTYGMAAWAVDARFLIPVVSYLYSTEGYIFMMDLCGVHYPDNSPAQIGVVYQLMNMVKNSRIRLKVLVNDVPEPHIPSLTGIYSAANWMERETYDFYGIHFDGHPDLRRILNEDQMTYFPMRKEYPLEEGARTDKADEMFGR